MTTGTTQSTFLSSAKQMKEQLGPALCLAKWKQVSLHLTTGMNNSCYHPPLHAINPERNQDRCVSIAQYRIQKNTTQNDVGWGETHRMSVLLEHGRSRQVKRQTLPIR
jgi:hypothetical protein